jgi:hypothetical protein
LETGKKTAVRFCAGAPTNKQTRTVNNSGVSSLIGRGGKMAQPFLSLNIPQKGLAAGIPVVASRNQELLRIFKRHVITDWKHRVSNSTDSVLKEVDRLELEKLKATLDLLVPDGPTEEGSGRGKG